MAASIGSTYIRDTFISNTCAINTRIRYSGIEIAYNKGICARSTFVRGVKPRALAKLEMI